MPPPPPRGRGGGGGAYVAPALRNRMAAAAAAAAAAEAGGAGGDAGGAAAAAAPPRSLDALAPHSMRLRVAFTAGGAFDWAGCPDPVIDDGGGDEDSGKGGDAAGGDPTAAAAAAAAATGANDTTTATTSTRTTTTSTRTLDSPVCPDEAQIVELLRWFSRAARDDRAAVLSLPPALSKVARAQWHACAERTGGLESASQGFGDARFLTIRPSAGRSGSGSGRGGVYGGGSGGGGGSWRRGPAPPPAAAALSADDAAAAEGSANGRAGERGAAGDTSSSPAPAAAAAAAAAPAGEGSSATAGGGGRGSGQGRGSSSGGLVKPLKQTRAKQVWSWCQQEGGRLWELSQGEVAELLRLPTDALERAASDLARCLRKRAAAAALARALQARDEPAALRVLQEQQQQEEGVGTRALAWTRDDASGGYAAHVAAWHGLGGALRVLVEAGGGADVLRQHDARRATPLQLLRERGHAALADELEAEFVAVGGGGGRPGGGGSGGGRGDGGVDRRGEAAAGAAAGGSGGVAGPPAGFSLGRGKAAAAPPAAAAGAGGGGSGVPPPAAPGSSAGAVQQQQQQQQEQPAAGPSAPGARGFASAQVAAPRQGAADEGAAPHVAPSPSPSQQHPDDAAADGAQPYCSYDSADDRVFTLFGRANAQRGRGGRSNALRGGARGHGGGGGGGGWGRGRGRANAGDEPGGGDGGAGGGGGGGEATQPERWR